MPIYSFIFAMIGVRIKRRSLALTNIIHMPKIITLSKAIGRLPNNSVRQRHARQDAQHDHELLARCRQAWNSLEDVRLTRDRVMRYCHGDQWGDTIRVWRGGYWQEMTEREYLERKNSTPLSNNIMSGLLTSIVGLYAKQGTEPVCFARTRDAQQLSDMMSATMQCNWQNTQMEDLLKHMFEDYLTGGVAIARETYEEREQELEDAWTDYIEPNYAFWEGGSDPRHLDLSLIGVLHDVQREDLYAKFTDYGWTVEELDSIFHLAPVDTTVSLQNNESYDVANVSFDTTNKPHCVRIIEVWTAESKMRYQCYDPIASNEADAFFRIDGEDTALIAELRAKNEERIRQYQEAGVLKEEWALITSKLILDKYWHFCFLAPDGTVLCEGETPYDYKSHPFTLKLYPYVNGKIHPYMGVTIDQQRYINRLIIMNDMAIRSAAKGLMMVPTTVLDGMTPEQFADQAVEYDGIMFFKPNKNYPNSRPEVITSNAVNLGVNEMLQIQLNLIRETSNVSGAIQGRTPSAGTSASRYAMEAQNATTALYSVLKDMETFTENVAKKKCMTIKQFYRDGRLVYNRDYTSEMEYDRMAARDVNFKISIKNAAASAAFQSQANDQLDKLLQMGAINIVQYLQNLSAPFADKLLQSVQQQQVEQQQMAEQLQQAAAQQGGGHVQDGQVQGADQQSVAQAQQMLQQY